MNRHYQGTTPGFLFLTTVRVTYSILLSELYGGNLGSTLQHFATTPRVLVLYEFESANMASLLVSMVSGRGGNGAPCGWPTPAKVSFFVSVALGLSLSVSQGCFALIVEK